LAGRRDVAAMDAPIRAAPMILKRTPSSFAGADPSRRTPYQKKNIRSILTWE
jgi:hypothetical protein